MPESMHGFAYKIQPVFVLNTKLSHRWDRHIHDRALRGPAGSARYAPKTFHFA